MVAFLPPYTRILDSSGTRQIGKFSGLKTTRLPLLSSWPPLEHMIIDGFRRTEDPKLQEMAYELAKVWIRVNYNAFNRTGVMWEKYDIDGQIGSGGEYVPQAGFGWTNGVVLDLM